MQGCARGAGSGGGHSPSWPQGSKSLCNSKDPFCPQKLQLVLAPLHSMASRALEHGLPDPSSLLTHSFQQLDRIDSLSEQISFLEEQLGSCECHPPHRAARTWAWG